MKPAYARRVATIRRRAISVTALFLLALLLTALSPALLLVALLADMVKRQRRLPATRLIAFGWYWSVIECAGVLISFVLWCAGQAKREEAHYRLMGWWAGKLMTGMKKALRFEPVIEGSEALGDGNAVVLCRHASLADSLLSAWVICTVHGIHPRYVLKRELLFDPCLDIVGLRVPNRFVDRGAADSSEDLHALGELAAGLTSGRVAVIFPEGTRATAEKRRRSLDKIGESNAARAERLDALHHLLPIRPAGVMALIDGAPHCDLILAWHTGFDGLSNFKGIYRAIVGPETPVRFVMRRIDRSCTGEITLEVLDDMWLQMDEEVHEALRVRT